MSIINNVKIKNYKAVEDMEFPAKPINIIVGPNNTGKSSVLESIWLTVSSFNSFEDSFGNKLSKILKTDYNSKYLIQKGKYKSSVRLGLSDDYEENDLLLNINYYEDDYPEEMKDYFLEFSENFKKKLMKRSIQRTASKFNLKMDQKDLEELDELKSKRSNIKSRIERYKRRFSPENPKVSENRKKQLEKYEDELENINDQIEKKSKKKEELADSVVEKLLNSEKIIISTKKGKNFFNIESMILAKETQRFNIFQSEIPEKDVIPIGFSEMASENRLQELYEETVNSKELWDILDILKDRVPYFEDIRKVKGELNVLFSDLNKPLPISSMGDGLKNLLKLSFTQHILNNGIVLFEEPENSLHPGYSEILVEEILNNSQDSQYFLTTHSHELIEEFLNKSKSHNMLDDILILRLNRTSNGLVDREYIHGSDALEEVKEIESDLRGF